MLKNNWRDPIWSNINNNWDVIIIGGGITGAGIFRMASQAGLKTLLVEKNDFAFGTSSRSSKLVHGGLRYIKSHQYNVTWESVRERERLLKEAPNLVTSLKFIFPLYESYHSSLWKFKLLLNIYDAFAGKKAHGSLSIEEMNQISPALKQEERIQSFYYFDAMVDDARLVLRNIQEGIEYGGTAINYVSVEELLLNLKNQVCGVTIIDNDPITNKRTAKLHSHVVINATGPWTDEIRSQVVDNKIIRKLRGSHIQITHERFPVDHAYSIFHPQDGRSFFVLPWENVTVIGTTDLDQPEEYEEKYHEPFMTNDELEYLLNGANHYFPEYTFTNADVISSFSGLRPIATGDTSDPSKASRAHILLEDNGLITISGGKLTTYRKMAYEVLVKIKTKLRKKIKIDAQKPVLYSIDNAEDKDFPIDSLNRWKGRFGKEYIQFIDSIHQDEVGFIGNSKSIWAEIRWAVKNEWVVHLDDLLLRRVRIGLLLPNGGLNEKSRIENIIKSELGWDNEKWLKELQRYKEIWSNHYYLPNSNKSFSRQEER